MEAAELEQSQQRAERNARDDDGLDTYLRLRSVLALTDSSKSTIRRWIAAGKFPRPIVRDGNTVLFSRREIREWQAQHARAQGKISPSPLAARAVTVSGTTAARRHIPKMEQ